MASSSDVSESSIIVGFIPLACNLLTDPAVPCLRASAESGGGLGRSTRSGTSVVLSVSAIIILSTQYFLWAKKTFGHHEPQNRYTMIHARGVVYKKIVYRVAQVKMQKVNPDFIRHKYFVILICRNFKVSSI